MLKKSCEQVCGRLRALVKNEHEIECEILDLMRVIYENRWHLELGYSSMYEFLVKDSKMYSATAQRRVEALRLIETIPQVAEMIRDGEEARN